MSSIHKELQELAIKMGAPVVGNNISEQIRALSVHLNGTSHGANIADRIDEFKKVYSSGGDAPVLITKSITENGTYSASSDNADGYSRVSVDVPDPTVITKEITENGTYSASDDNAYGYSSVSVEVPSKPGYALALRAAASGTSGSKYVSGPFLFRNLTENGTAGYSLSGDISGISLIPNPIVDPDAVYPEFSMDITVKFADDVLTNAASYNQARVTGGGANGRYGYYIDPTSTYMMNNGVYGGYVTVIDTDNFVETGYFWADHRLPLSELPGSEHTFGIRCENETIILSRDNVDAFSTTIKDHWSTSASDWGYGFAVGEVRDGLGSSYGSAKMSVKSFIIDFG